MIQILFPCFQFCFEIYAPNSGSVIKACKTDSDGKVVVGRSAFFRKLCDHFLKINLKFSGDRCISVFTEL